MDKDYLTLKRASASRPSGEWDDDDYDVLADDAVVGRLMRARAAPVGWQGWGPPAIGHHEDPPPTPGYEPPREAAGAPFAKGGRRKYPRLAIGEAAGAFFRDAARQHHAGRAC